MPIARPCLASLVSLTCLLGIAACDPGSSSDDEGGGDSEGDSEGDAGDDQGDDEAGPDDSAGESGDDDGVADTTSDDGADTASDDGGSPIGDDVFFFVRTVADDNDEVWAYDVAADTSHRAFAFDSAAEIQSLAIHPDRDVLAIASDYDAIDYQASESIHVLAVDGDVELGTPELLMEPWPKPLGAGTGYAQQIDDLRWHPDGSMLWFGHAFQFGISEPGGSALASLDPATGETQLYDEFVGSCTVSSGPSPSPDGSVLLAVRAVCIESADAGIVGFDVPLVAQPQVILPSPNILFSTPRWLPDGTGIVYAADIDWDNDGDGTFDIFGSAMLLLDLTDGAQYALVPPSEGMNIWDFTISPDGTRLVACVSHDGARDLVLADFSGDEATTRWLTDDGVSCKPSW